MIGYENSKIPRLYELMEKRGIKAKDITAATGISSGNIADWKSGRSTPSGERLITLAGFFGVSVEYLTGSDQDENALDLSIQAELQQLSDDKKKDVLKYIKFVQTSE